MATSGKAGWDFARRLRRGAYGWKTGPALKSVRAAVSEVKQAARKDPVRAAEGAVLFLERVSPAIEGVDSSSGSIGTAVWRAVGALTAILAKADVDDATRHAWLERVWAAFEADEIPYLERLGESWGELCVTPEVASSWADRLLGPVKQALFYEGPEFRFFKGTQACLSALHRAGRHDELLALLAQNDFWPYQRWVVKALVARGRKADALNHAEGCRSPWSDDGEIDRMCEEILLSSGLREEAYRRYGLSGHGNKTYLAWFRAVRKAYPEKTPEQVLADLVAATPGLEGKWFAAAKSVGLLDEALALARRGSCDPLTLSRAARDFADKDPAFAAEAGLLALAGMVRGDAYELHARDVHDALRHTAAAALRLDAPDEVRERILKVRDMEGVNRDFVARILDAALDEPV